MPSEDDGGLAAWVPVRRVSVPLLLAVLQPGRVSVSTKGGVRVEGVGWAEGVFGQQLVVQVQIGAVSVGEKQKLNCECFSQFTAVYLKISSETFIVIAAAQRVMSVRLNPSAHRTEREEGIRVWITCGRFG